jgi:GTP-binding protein HflX
LKARTPGGRDPAAQLAEAIGLAQAISLDVVHAESVALRSARPATLIGAGKVAELKEIVSDAKVDVAIVDGELSPVQQRNLETSWNCKVIDRTGLILEIFSARARTREGRLQVELAQLTYQRSRLVRSWTHLERQRGGLGTVGGPGESQLEADRRMIDQRITRLKRQLKAVSRTRELHRKRRRQAPWPVIALVGYTNAGKSTLFNRLTAEQVFAEDLLFATLDPTMRGVRLPSGRQVVLSDTVGFVSDLPTHLIAAFRATLEEVLEADLILHVRDIAHPESDAQSADVESVLADLGLGLDATERILEVLNKIDLLDGPAFARVTNGSLRHDDEVPISAITGAGIETLLTRVEARLSERQEILEIALDAEDGSNLAWLYRHGRVLSRDDAEGRVRLKVGLDPIDLGRWRKRAEEHPERI